MRFRNLLLKIERFFLYANFFFAALLLLSYLSAIISPQKFWLLAFLGLAYPVLLVLNLIFCIYWAIRAKKYFLVSGISIIVGVGVLLNTIQFSKSPGAASLASTPHLRLMTYNVHNFRTLDTPRSFPTDTSVLKLIDSSQPDVIGFEEYNTRSKIDRSLTKVLHINQFYFEPFVKALHDSTGLAIFSKYPIVNSGLVGLSENPDDNQAIYIDIKYKSGLLRIYDFHLHSLEFDREEYFLLKNFYHRSVIRMPGWQKIFYKLKEGFIIRAMQVDRIRQHAAKCPYPYIFMGDFNDSPSSYTFNQMAKGMKNTFKEKGTGIGKTFNGGFATLQIDYILVSRQFHVLDYQTIRQAISDHYPVYSDVALN
jgi:endonuclease/exonuclease/phosphatase family metal-dependent hydrolase